MKRAFLVLILVLSLVFVGFAENNNRQVTAQKNSFQLNPELFLQWPLTAVIINPWVSDYKAWGLVLLGVDITAFEHGRWNFIGIGGGIASCFKKIDEPYYTEPFSYWNPVTNTYESYPGGMIDSKDVVLFYLKFIPVKYQLYKEIYLEVSITTRRMIVFGLTMNFDAFKR